MSVATALSPYPMFRLTIPLVAGIFLSDTWLRPCNLWAEHAVALAVLFVLLVGLRNDRSYGRCWLFGAVLDLFLLLGGSLLVQWQWKEVDACWSDSAAGYRGMVVEPPKEKARTMSCVTEVGGKHILLYLHKDSLSESLRCGDEVLFHTRVSSPRNAGNPYEFDYASYLLRKKISGTAYVYAGHWRKTGRTAPLTLEQKALACREKVIGWYREWGFTGQELAVLSALTVGSKEELSDELREAYSVAGISHILALSGLHIGILWGVLSFLLRPLRRNAALRVARWVAVAAVLWGYAFVAGLAASVVRAVIMCLLAELGRINGSKTVSLNVMGVAAFLMLAYNPFFLFDVGFRLSFMAVLAILLVYPRLYALCPLRQRGWKWCWGVLSVSVAAQLGTAPLVMYYFSSFSVYFLLANLLVTPLVPVVMYMALLALLLSPFPFLHGGVVWILEGLVRLLNGTAGWVSRLPASSIDSLYWSSAEVALLYGVTALALAFWVTARRGALISLLAVTALFLSVFSFNRLPHPSSPQVVFYNLRDCPAVHFIEPDKSSYLQLAEKDSSLSALKYISRSYWKREGLAYPHLLSGGYESREVWSRNGITRWRGMNVCMLADDRWRGKKAADVLELDYMYLCKGYKGKIAPLRKLFRMKCVVLDSSLGAWRSGMLKEECRSLGIEYIDMSEKGSFQILL